MPPMTRKARRSASRIGPRGVADRPARARAGEPSRRDTYGRERPPPGGGGCATPGATPPHRLTAPAVKKGGSLPSRPSPLARLVSSGLGRKTRTGTAKNGRVVCHTPPSLFATPPPVSAWHVACPAPCHGTGTHGGHHQIAASGPVSREVDQMWKRSIATRAVVVVGVPSGSWRSSFRRSTAILNPPHSPSKERLPPSVASLKRAISWLMSGSAWVCPVGISTPGPSPSRVQCFSAGAARSAASAPMPTAATCTAKVRARSAAHRGA